MPLFNECLLINIIVLYIRRFPLPRASWVVTLWLWALCGCSVNVVISELCCCCTSPKHFLWPSGWKLFFTHHFSLACWFDIHYIILFFCEFSFSYFYYVTGLNIFCSFGHSHHVCSLFNPSLMVLMMSCWHHWVEPTEGVFIFVRMFLLFSNSFWGNVLGLTCLLIEPFSHVNVLEKSLIRTLISLCWDYCVGSCWVIWCWLEGLKCEMIAL